MIEFYQNIPNFISPIAFTMGSVSVHWYSLMWLVAFVVVYVLLVWRIKRKEGKEYSIYFIQDVVANSLIGALIGGRLGYVIFYDLLYFMTHPLQIVSPYDFVSGEWIGIYGMSYHGGILGVAIAIAYSAYKNKKNILRLFDFIAPVAPLGYMFGRFGNFFNAELVGRITTSNFGMYFNNENSLRHPSQLYEAMFEGLLLFVVLWNLRNRNLPKGALTALYIIGYSLTRFIVEFFRQPDEHLGFVVASFTMGQILSFTMFLVGMVLLFVSYRTNKIKKL
jgi:phosphatidylglycerol:prolipoprotein diacylglycerol transferase